MFVICRNTILVIYHLQSIEDASCKLAAFSQLPV